MSRAMKPGDDFKIVRLLGALRGTVPTVDVEASVFERILRLPVPGPAVPRVSLWQFGWGSAAAIACIGLGALGLLATIGPGQLGPAAAASQGLLTAVKSIGRASFGRLVEIAGLASSVAARFDGALILPVGLAVLTCAAMVTLTVLVVSREALGKRVAG